MLNPTINNPTMNISILTGSFLVRIAASGAAMAPPINSPRDNLPVTQKVEGQHKSNRFGKGHKELRKIDRANRLARILSTHHQGGSCDRPPAASPDASKKPPIRPRILTRAVCTPLRGLAV